MSIIYEALKKTQANSDIASPDAPVKTERKAIPVKPIGRKLILPVVIVVFLSGMSWAVPFILTKTAILPKLVSASRAQLVPDARTEKTIIRENFVSQNNPMAGGVTLTKDAEESSANARYEPRFILNGIVLSGDGNIALINDQIARVGDIIEDALVEEIADKRVVLNYRTRKIILEAK